METITDIGQLDFSKSYTYADYLTWKIQERLEIIRGKIFQMAPAPSSYHQHCVSFLNATLYMFLKGKPCHVFPAPYDVIIPSLEGIENTVVQPDLTVVCDEHKITEAGCKGVPDLVVEVVSRSSVKKDLHEKYHLYETAGVKEYWLVNPIDRSLVVFLLDTNGKYQSSKPLTLGDRARSSILSGFSISMDELFIDLAEEPEGIYEQGIKRI